MLTFKTSYILFILLLFYILDQNQQHVRLSINTVPLPVCRSQLRAYWFLLKTDIFKNK